MVAAVALMNAMASVLADETRLLTIPRPTWVVGLLMSTMSPISRPLTVKGCSTVVFGATEDGEIVIASTHCPLILPNEAVLGLLMRLSLRRLAQQAGCDAMIVEVAAPRPRAAMAEGDVRVDPQEISGRTPAAAKVY